MPPGFITASHLSARGNEQLSPAPGWRPSQQQKGSIYHGNDTQSPGVRAGEELESRGKVRADGGVKNPPCMISVVQTSKAIPNYPRECTEGMSECAAICELLQPPLHHSRGGMCCFLDTGKKTDALLPASLWPPPVSIISLLGESHSN